MRFQPFSVYLAKGFKGSGFGNLLGVVQFSMQQGKQFVLFHPWTVIHYLEINFIESFKS